MTRGINIYSEIGNLNKVMLHRIGHEVEGLVPENFERLLFDDIPFLKVAQREHDNFASVLAKCGVEVLYLEDRMAGILEDQELKAQFAEEILNASGVKSQGVREALTEYLMDKEAKDMVQTVIRGIKKEELPDIKAKTLADMISSAYPFYIDPLPNAYFTRDPGACIGDGISIHPMCTETRKRESILYRFLYDHDKELIPEGTPLFYDLDGPASLEGGDIHVLNERIIAVGLSSRTTPRAIEQFAKTIFSMTDFEKILIINIPKIRAYMHLDTLFTMVDYDKFAIHPEMERIQDKFEITRGPGGRIQVSNVTDPLDVMLKKALNLSSVKLIHCGGGDELAAQREQWSDAANVLAVEPGKVITYQRNHITNDVLDMNHIDVVTISGSELSRGRGGTRCMCFPIDREELL